MPFGLSAFVTDGITEVLRSEPRLKKVRVFGSRAKGTSRPSSDVDLALFAPSLDFDGFLDLRAKLDDLPCVFSLDTVHFDALENDRLKEAILRDGVPWPGI